jgi:MFS family permease
MAVGSGLGTVIAGPVADVFGWRFLFALPLVLSLGGLVIAYRYMGESARQPGIGLNPTAAILLSGWLVALLLPLSAGNLWGWGSPIVVGLLVVAAALAAAWVFVELRASNPLVDMRMMRLPAVWTTNLAGLLLGASMFGMWAYLPRLAETPASSGYGLGATVSAAGIIMLPMLVTMGSVGLIAGPLSRVLPFAVQLTAGALLSSGASLSMALFHDDAGQLAIAAGVFGLGLGLTVSAMPNLIVRSVPAGEVGIATGMNTNIRTIGGAVGTTIFSAVIGATVGASGLATEGGYVAAFIVGAALAAAAGIAPFFGRPRRERSLPEPHPVAANTLTEAEAAV